MKIFKTQILVGLVSLLVLSQGCTHSTDAIEQDTLVHSKGVEDKYPEFSWDTIPLYMHVWKRTSYTEDEIKYLAKFPLITLEKAQGIKEGSVQKGTLKAARSIKAINPNSKILYYKNIVIDWNSAASESLKKLPDGYLQQINGTYPVVNENSKAKFFDISKDNVQQWWLEDARLMLNDPAIDGVFIDANIKVLIHKYFSKMKGLGDKKAEELIDGYHVLLNKINNEFRDDNIVLANLIRARFENAGLEYIEYFDGSYFENFELNVNGVSRVDYIVKGIEAGQKAGKEGKILAFTAGLGDIQENDSSGIGLDEARKSINDINHIQKRLDYLTAIFLVMAEKYSYFYPHDGFGVHTERKSKKVNRTWMKNLPIFNKRLGEPKGPAKREGYIFTREFEYCSVHLNVETQEAKLMWK